MESSTGGDDNVTPLPAQAAVISPALRSQISELLGSISEPGCIHIWMQGCIVFASPNDGRIQVYGFERKDGSHPIVQGMIQEVIARASPAQDNQQEGHELVSLSSLTDSPEIAATKRHNRLLGLHVSSALRRWRRKGIDKKSAMESAAISYALSASTVSILVKLANEARRKRVARIRETLIRIWYAERVELAEMARRLNVSLVHARRLRNFVLDEMYLEEERNAPA